MSRIDCLVFDDGRKIKRFLDLPNSINFKKICVGVPINEQLIQFIPQNGFDISPNNYYRY